MDRTTKAGLSLVSLLALSSPALANTVVLTPLVPNGATEKTVVNVHQLMSSELEFMSEVSGVREVDRRPASLDVNCISNDACLRGILTTAGGDSLLTGVLTDQGSAGIVLDLVYFSQGRIARRKAFTVGDSATQLANKMTGILNEMVAGAAPAGDPRAATPPPAAFAGSFGDEDDFAMAPAPSAPAPQQGNAFAFNDGLVDAGPSPAEIARQQAEQEARMRAEQEARMRAEQEARMRAEQEARMRADEEARRRAEEESRMRAEQEARARAEQEARARAEQEARARAEQEARARAEEEARRQAYEQELARKRAENDRMRAEEEARRQAEEQARMQAAAAAQAPAYAPPAYSAPAAPAGSGGISFASSADKITAEQIDAVIQFGAPAGGAPTPSPAAYTPTSYAPPAQAYTAPAPAYTPPTQAYTVPAPAYSAPAPSYAPAPTYTAPAPAYGGSPSYGAAPSNGYGQPSPQPSYGGTSYGQPAPAYGQPPARGGSDSSLAMEEQELAAMENPGLLDLDSDKKGRDRKASGNSQATLDRATPKTMQISVRGGYSKYFAFDFITAGGEVGVPLSKGLMAIAGVEAYSVQRELPPEFQVPGQPIAVWNTIYPINVGLAYKIQTGSIATPYVGADAIFVQYYKDEVGADWAGGARVRGGVDLMVAKNFGLNANLAVGGWSGKNWTLIDATVGNSGLLPQINAGTVIAF